MEYPPESSTAEEDAFKNSCDNMWEIRYSSEFQALKLQFYGLYKAATVGKCDIPEPRAVMGNETVRAKWDAWIKASTFSKAAARAQYTKLAAGVIKARAEAEQA
ncbi:unnamed protein product, partial [Discosporangium mesarthrocarpum]